MTLYHLLGVNCPRCPRDLMGTNHGVTWFPNSATCDWCKVEFDRLLEIGAIEVDAEARIVPVGADWARGIPTGIRVVGQ